MRKAGMADEMLARPDPSASALEWSAVGTNVARHGAMHPRAFLRPVLLEHPAKSSESAFDPDCFDFTAYLGRRLGVEKEVASEVLGHWLMTYEPADQEVAGHASQESSPSIAPISGIHSVERPTPYRELTGTDG